MTQPSFSEPAEWEDAQFDWGAKTYYWVSLPVMFGKPNKLFETVQHLRAAINSKGYEIKPDALLLFQIELFKGKVMIEITKPEAYDAQIVQTEAAKVYSTVHNGPMKTAKKSADALKQHVFSTKGITPNAVFYSDFRHGAELTGQRADKVLILARV